MKLKPPEYSPVLIDTVEKALEPYKRILSPEMVDHFRQEALLQLSMHPYPAELIRKLTPPVVQQSGDKPVKHDENGAAEQPPKRAKRTKREDA